MRLDECLNFQLTNAQNAVYSYFKDKLLPFDITPMQYAVLKCLWQQDEQTPTQLARALHLDTSTVTGLLGRMELKNLIERIHSKTDRRMVVIRTQSLGQSLQPGVEQAISQANQEILQEFGAQELQSFSRTLGRIIDRIQFLQE